MCFWHHLMSIDFNRHLLEKDKMKIDNNNSNKGLSQLITQMNTLPQQQPLSIQWLMITINHFHSLHTTTAPPPNVQLQLTRPPDTVTVNPTTTIAMVYHLKIMIYQRQPHSPTTTTTITVTGHLITITINLKPTDLTRHLHQPIN